LRPVAPARSFPADRGAPGCGEGAAGGRCRRCGVRRFSSLAHL